MDRNGIFNNQNDRIRQIGIEYSIIGMIGLGGPELNIVDRNRIFNSQNDWIRCVGIEYCGSELNIQ